MRPSARLILTLVVSFFAIAIVGGFPATASATPITWVLAGEVTGATWPPGGGTASLDQLFARYPVGTDIRIEMHLDDFARDSCANPGSGLFMFPSAAAVTMGGDSGLYAVSFEMNAPAGNCPFGPHMESFNPLSPADIRIIRQTGTIGGSTFVLSGLSGGAGGGWLTLNCVVCAEGVLFKVQTESYAVPEPVSTSLMAAGLLALRVRRRRRRSA